MTKITVGQTPVVLSACCRQGGYVCEDRCCAIDQSVTEPHGGLMVLLMYWYKQVRMYGVSDCDPGAIQASSRQILWQLHPLNPLHDLDDRDVFPKPLNRSYSGKVLLRQIDYENTIQRARGGVLAIRSKLCQFGHETFRNGVIHEYVRKMQGPATRWKGPIRGN